MSRGARNPFYHRQAVQGPEHFYGRGELLRQITEMIRGGQSCALVGERRIGKSSLLACLGDARGQEPWLEENERLLPVLLDFLGFQKVSAEDLWCEILEGLGTACGSLPEGKPSFASVRKAVRNLCRDGGRVVLLCDEFELAVENPQLDEGFFGALRSLAGSTGVAFVTASRLSLLELDQYRDESVRRKVLGSPFFNIFAEFPVGPFESVEVAELLEGSLSGHPVRFFTEDSLFLDRVAGRHPYFLQVAAYHLYESLARSPHLDRSRIHAEAKEKLSRDSATVFRNLWQHSRPEERRALLHLADAEGENDFAPGADYERTLDQLEMRGLVCRERAEVGAGESRVFSTIFADWLRSQGNPSIAAGS